MASLAAQAAQGSDDIQGNLSLIYEEESVSPSDSDSLDPNDNLDYMGVWCTDDVFLASIPDDVT